MSTLDTAITALADHLKVSTGGHHATALPEITLLWRDTPMRRLALMLEPGIVILSNGCLTLTSLNKRPTICAGQYLQLGVPMTLETRLDACSAEHLRGLVIRVSTDMLRDISNNMDSTDTGSTALCAIETVSTSDGTADATRRLAACLTNPEEARVLGPALTREVVFRALKDARSPALLALLNPNSANARISQVISTLKGNLAKPRSIDEMAKQAGMSVSVFHREFKRAIGETPLKHVKRLRLTEARKLIVHSGLSAKQTAHELGYASTSHFSRDFKRQFGVTTLEARQRYLAGQQETGLSTNEPQPFLYW